MLAERKHYSRANAFGEMHCDGFLWIEKCEEVQVIVEERQSYRFIYIKDSTSFHIRELYYKWVYPAYNKKRLSGLTIPKFRKQGFKHYCPEKDRFKGFTYGDCRDSGYILSMNMYGNVFDKADRADERTLFAIDCLNFWEVYLDDPHN